MQTDLQSSVRDAGRFFVLVGAIKSRGNIISVFTRDILSRKHRKSAYLYTKPT